MWPAVIECITGCVGAIVNEVVIKNATASIWEKDILLFFVESGRFAN
jgi:hypothetical protein